MLNDREDGRPYVKRCLIHDIEKFYSTVNKIMSAQGDERKRNHSTNVSAEKQFPMHERRTSNPEHMKNIIGLALQRNQISNQYHNQAYPYFLRSQGPFEVYDHAQSKGQQFVQNLQETNNQAHERFVKECEEIKAVRHYEKDQFHW